MSKMDLTALRIRDMLYAVDKGAGRPWSGSVADIVALTGSDKRRVPDALWQLVDDGCPVEFRQGTITFAGVASAAPVTATAAAYVIESTAEVLTEADLAERAHRCAMTRRQAREDAWRRAGQLTFDDMDWEPAPASVKKVERPKPTAERLPTQSVAALRVRTTTTEQPSNRATEQPSNGCSVENLSDSQKAIFERIQNRLRGKQPISEPETQKNFESSLNPINQELINPIKTIIPIVPNLTPIQEPVIPDQTNARWDQTRYLEYLEEGKRRFPQWSQRLYNPETQRWGCCEWAIKRLAAIMAYGAPPDVFEQVMEFVASPDPHVRARLPTAALLFKVKELSKIWRYTKR